MAKLSILLLAAFLALAASQQAREPRNRAAFQSFNNILPNLWWFRPQHVRETVLPLQQRPPPPHIVKPKPPVRQFNTYPGINYWPGFNPKTGLIRSGPAIPGLEYLSGSENPYYIVIDANTAQGIYLAGGNMNTNSSAFNNFSPFQTNGSPFANSSSFASSSPFMGNSPFTSNSAFGSFSQQQPQRPNFPGLQYLNTSPYIIIDPSNVPGIYLASGNINNSNTASQDTVLDRILGGRHRPQVAPSAATTTEVPISELLHNLGEINEEEDQDNVVVVAPSAEQSAMESPRQVDINEDDISAEEALALLERHSTRGLSPKHLLMLLSQDSRQRRRIQEAVADVYWRNYNLQQQK